MSLQSKTFAIEVRASKHGKGIFATRDIAKGEELYQYTGHYINFDQCQSLGENECYPIQVEIDRYLVADLPGCFINHSCSPNAGLNEQMRLVALCPINAGQEIFLDYSTTMWERSWTMRCSCGSENCRSIIEDFDLIPAEKQVAYIKLNIVSPFILKSILTKSDE